MEIVIYTEAYKYIENINEVLYDNTYFNIFKYNWYLILFYSKDVLNFGLNSLVSSTALSYFIFAKQLLFVNDSEMYLIFFLWFLT